jgi:hypothetical protein
VTRSADDGASNRVLGITFSFGSNDFADSLLLADTERLLAAKTKLDAVPARLLQRVDNRDLTVAEHGWQTRPWLIEEKLLDATDAARRMAVARNGLRSRDHFRPDTPGDWSSARRSTNR